METAEVVANFKDVEKDFKQGLVNAEFNSNESGNHPEAVIAGKPPLDIGSPAIKVFCRIKNGIQFKMVTKNLPEAVTEKLQHFNEVKDPEVIVYKKALDQYGAEFLPEELIELINKYSNSSLAPLIEWEIEKFKLMRAEAMNLLREHQEEKK